MTLGKHDTNAMGDLLGISPKINTQRKLSPPCPALRHALPYLSRDIQVERELAGEMQQLRLRSRLAPVDPRALPRLPETEQKAGPQS